MEERRDLRPLVLFLNELNRTDREVGGIDPFMTVRLLDIFIMRLQAIMANFQENRDTEDTVRRIDELMEFVRNSRRAMAVLRDEPTTEEV